MPRRDAGVFCVSYPPSAPASLPPPPARKKNNEKIVDDDCEKNFFFYFCSVVFYCEDVLEMKWFNRPFSSSLEAEHHIH
jgi:hypothetical protein